MNMMSDLSFDPTDVCSRINPALFEEPFRVDASQLVGKIVFVDPRRVKEMPGQPRTKVEDIEELAESIKVDGQKDAALVFPIVHPDFDVELEAGHRRRASCELNARFLRAEIRPVPANREEQYDDAFINNFNREDLSLLDTVLSVEQLLKNGRSREDIARMAGKTLVWADQYIILAKMNSEVRPLMKKLNEGQRSSGGRKLRRKTVLPLSIWLQVARVPQEEQPAYAEKLIEGDSSIGAVRAQIHRDLIQRGEKPRQRASELMSAVVNRTNELGLSLERCSGLKPSELQGALKARQLEAHWTAMSMRQLACSLKIVADAIDPPPMTPFEPELRGLVEAFREDSEILLNPGRLSLLDRWRLLVFQGAQLGK